MRAVVAVREQLLARSARVLRATSSRVATLLEYVQARSVGSGGSEKPKYPRFMYGGVGSRYSPESRLAPASSLPALRGRGRISAPFLSSRAHPPPNFYYSLPATACQCLARHRLSAPADIMHGSAALVPVQPLELSQGDLEELRHRLLGVALVQRPARAAAGAHRAGGCWSASHSHAPSNCEACTSQPNCEYARAGLRACHRRARPRHRPCT